MTNKKGDKTGEKGRQKGEGGHSDQQEGRQRETSRTEGGHAVPQQGGHSSNSRLFGEIQKSPWRQMNKNAAWPAEKGGHQQQAPNLGDELKRCMASGERIENP